MARQWRNNLIPSLGQHVETTLDELASHLAAGLALLLQDASRFTSSLSSLSSDERRQDASPVLPVSHLSQPELHDLAADDPLDEALRHAACHDGVISAPTGFAAKVLARVPAGPPPLANVENHTGNPFDILKEHAHLLFGTLSFSALLTFGTSWLIAATAPSLAFAILATLVSLGLLLAEGLRLVWQTTTGAASNPLLVLMAMSAPLAVFLVACTQLARLSRTSRLSRIRVTWPGLA